MTTFTLTGTFTHQNGITPISKSPIHVQADPFPLASSVQTDRMEKATDANGTVSFTLTTGVTGLYYVVRSTAKRPLFKPIRFLAPAAGTVLDIKTLIFYSPGDPPLAADLLAIRDAAISAANDSAAASLYGHFPTGLHGNGATDDKPSISTALGTLPASSGLFTDTASLKTIIDGGGVVTIPPGSYALNSELVIPPRTMLFAYGVRFVLTSAAARIRVIPNPFAGAFSSDFCGLQGAVIDGNGVGTNGLYLDASSHAHINNVTVIRTVGDGVVLNGAQWTHLSNVVADGCGGWGFHLQAFTTGGLPDCNNNRFTDCFAQANTLGGVKLSDEAQANAFIGLTSQFHASGVGVLFSDKAKNNAILSGHFEGNPTHIQFDNAAVTANSVIAPYFVVSSVCQRFVVNSGTDTKILTPGSNNASTLATKTGAIAPYEQDAANGWMTVSNPFRITAGGLTSMFVDSAGVDMDPKTVPQTGATVRVRVQENDTRNQPTTYWTTQNFVRQATSDQVFTAKVSGDTQPRWQIVGSGNQSWGTGSASPDVLLQRLAADVLGMAAGDSFKVEGIYNGGSFRVGNTRLWVDSTGVLRASTGAPASDTDGAAITSGTGNTATTTQLATAANAINTSGKYAGKRAWNTTSNRPVWATGSTTTSTWVFADGTTAHTPA